MNAKHLLFARWAVAVALPLCLSAQAGPINLTGNASPGVVIPDNDLSGVASTISLIAPASQITGVSLTLDITGDPVAYNGDFYAYLQFNTGLMVLLNNIDTSPSLPFGSPGSGINVTLSDGNPNIGAAPYTAGQPLTGTYAPQGGGASTGTSLGNTFDGMNPNGGWTLFIADESPGGVGELAAWTLDVTANTTPANTVPDQGSTLGMLVAGAGLLALCPLRRRAAKSRHGAAIFAAAAD